MPTICIWSWYNQVPRRCWKQRRGGTTIPGQGKIAMQSHGSTHVATCPQCETSFPLPIWKAREGRRFCTLACYWASMRVIRPLDAERFWSRVDKSDACWVWTAKRSPNGYGRFSHNNRQQAAHRLAWEMVGGPIPDGMKVCHDCPDGDNRACVRNDEPGIYIINGIARPRFGHLWLGTQAENLADMVNKGRAATGDRHGSRTHPERIARGTHSGAYLHPESVPRGEQNGQAKTTADGVRQIRARYAAGGILQRELAVEYGMSREQISAIIRRVDWRHVD